MPYMKYPHTKIALLLTHQQRLSFIFEVACGFTIQTVIRGGRAAPAYKPYIAVWTSRPLAC